MCCKLRDLVFESMDHNLAVLSFDPVAMRMSFGDTAMQLTSLSCAFTEESDVRDMIERLCTFESTSDIMEALFEDDPGFLMNPKD